MEQKSVRLTLKSGQSFEVLLPESPLVVSMPISLEELKTKISRHLGDTSQQSWFLLNKRTEGLNSLLVCGT
jgi:hypothetical protein